MKKREYLVFNSVLVLGISLIFLVLLLSVLPVLCFAEETSIKKETSIDKETLVNKETTLDKLSNSFGEKLGSKLGDKLNDNFEVNIILKDLTTNKPLTDLFVTYNIDGITSTIYLDTTSTTSAITLLLKKGTHNIEIRADDKNTPVIDYYGTQKFDVEFDAEVEEVEGSAESKTTTLFVSLYPVGLLRGFVKDKLDNIIPYADLKFECISNVII